MAEKSTSQEIAENLKRLEIFKTLPDETIAGLVNHVETIKLQPDQALFKQGDAGDAVYIIREGKVKIVGTEKDGREIVFNQQGAGAVIGEMALIDNEPRSAGVVALDNVEMFRLSREQFLNVLTTQPLVGWEVSRSAIGRLRFATTSIENAIEWSKQIAAGNYDSVAEETRQATEEEGMTQSDQERSQRFRETFFQMVKEVREREEVLKEQVQQLKVVIDQHKREQEVSELASSEFFQNLQKSSKKMRNEGKGEE